MPIRTLDITTRQRCEFVEITDRARALVRESGVREGVLILQSQHTTAGLTINENADPDVRRDLIAKLGELVPHAEPYYGHSEGNSDSHLKSSIVGLSLSVMVTGGDLLLGRWQGIYFCEWDGPRDRKVAAMVLRGS